MGVVIATVVIVLAAIGIGYWTSNALMPRFGLTPMRELPPSRQRLFWLSMTVGIVMAAFEGWAFSTHHGAVGVAGFIAVFVLPEFVLVPVRIRKARRAAEHSRARRTSSRRHSG